MANPKSSLSIPPLVSKRFTLIGIILLCVLLQIINSLPGVNLNGLGIYPRSLSGLTGIFYMAAGHICLVT